MSTLFRLFEGLSTTALVALIALGAVQLTLQVIALADLTRRTRVNGGRKWVWAVVTVLGGVIGASVYLAVGRAGPPASDTEAANEVARRRALDTLYGPEGRQ